MSEKEKEAEIDSDLIDKINVELQYGEKFPFPYPQHVKFENFTPDPNFTWKSFEETFASARISDSSTVPNKPNIVLHFLGYSYDILEPENAGPMPGASFKDLQKVVHHYIINYFLIDDTISVIEPPVPNSSLYQGTIIKRIKIPKYPEGKDFYSFSDFKIGNELNFFERKIVIYGFDLQTEVIEI